MSQHFLHHNRALEQVVPKTRFPKGEGITITKNAFFTNLRPPLLWWIYQIYSKLLFPAYQRQNVKKIVAPCNQDTLFVCISCRGKGQRKVHIRTGHEGQERELRYSSTLSLSSAIDGVGGQRHSSTALPPPPPRGQTRYPLYRRLGVPKSRSGRMRKISPPTGFDPWSVQPVASRYTD
jgi:hypothetical protein